MKYLHLVLVNLRRKKLRTALTVGSFLVALFLFGLLVIIRGALIGGVDVAGANRLVVRNKVSLIMPLPFAYRDQMRSLPHVATVTFATWFGGYYQDQKNFFPNYAVDAETYRSVYPEYIIPDDQWNAFLRDRQGCIVSPVLAKRFGLKLGDRIPLQGTIWTGTWELNLRGIYDVTRKEL
ncbi:MAG TPA: ABC transporter permease, partial [bacterium]|nr:ABC transporter permease [bacterium]